MVPVLWACPEASVLPASHSEVRFSNGDFELEGTLSLPQHEEGEALPGLVLGHGSGPNSRDQPMAGQLNMSFGMTIEVFAELTEDLVAAGYAVLRYDKRTCGPFNGLCANDYGLQDDYLIDDFIGDAVAAVDHLSTVAEIDLTRLVYVGHSQGAAFGPQVLDRSGLVAAGVLLAGNHSPIDAILSQQLADSEELLRALGYGEPDIAAQFPELRQLIADLASLRAGSFAGDSIAGASVAFWQSWLDQGDAVPTLTRALDRPLLALLGDYDWNVTAPELEAWQASFDASSGSPGHRSALLPCVTHALNCVSEPDWSAITLDDIGPSVAPAVVEEILLFLDGVFAG
jgi:pimeloyl-ACP methyl ester carboxylesterase